MATKFAKGEVVKVVMTVPSGAVQAMRMSEDGVVSYLINWVDENNTNKSRWFEENKLTTA